MNINRFQIDVATGRFTLPVVILICILLWGTSVTSWAELGSMVIIALTGYLMLEANTTFTLIRTRTALPFCIYWFLSTLFFFLHPFEWTLLVPLAFWLAIIQLFMSYESSSASTIIFHSFFFIGLGSLVFPQLLYFTPLFFFSMIGFRSLTVKSWFGGLLGLTTPYWFLLGHAFYHDQMHFFYQPLKECVHFYPITYQHLPFNELVSWGIVTILFLVSGIHYLHVSYHDKTRTRIYMSFLVATGFWTTIFMFLQPVHLHVLLPIQMLCTSFLLGHLFTLTRNRFSGIFFVVTFITLILLTFYHLWMQYFNF